MKAVVVSILLLWMSACASIPDARIQRDLRYGAGAERQLGDFYRPAVSGPWPAVLLIHGGSWARGDRDDMEKFAARFVEAGYAVFNVQYRLAPEHVHPAQIDDVRAAFRWMRTHAGVLGIDAERIVAMGYSAGAHLALLLALEDGVEPRPAAAVGGSAPTDLLAYPRSPLIREFIGGSPDERPEAWEAASPISHVDAGDPPVFLYHGARDRLVSVEQSRRLHLRLQESGVPSELVEQPWTGHATTYLFDEDSFEQALVFLDAQLR